MSNQTPEPAPFPTTPVGFEFPTDPEADLPVPAVVEAPRPVSVAPPAPPAPPAPSAPPAVPDSVPQPSPIAAETFAPPAMVAPPQPVAEFAPPTPVQAPAPVVIAEPVPIDEESIADLLGIQPEETEAVPVEAPRSVPPRAASGSSTELAAPPKRAPLAVPTHDPRGDIGAVADQGSQIAPKEINKEISFDGRPEIERLLYSLVANGGSDMHLAGGEVPRYRVAGALLPVAGEQVLTTEHIERMLAEIVPATQWEKFKRPAAQGGGDLDCAYAMSEKNGASLTVRFRCNVFRSMDETGAVFRVIPTKIVPLDDLGILPQVKTLATKPRGLILFCGPTGSGKSTSMAGLVDLINETRTERIFTLEDPVEFTHQSKKCLVNHREIEADTESFLEGLKRVRREDPDIILIGEMRDYETIGAAIEAADTGHLVIATLHTNSAPDTISRIVNSFPAERQEQIRITLAETLLAVICQTLVPSPTSPRGRVVAQEIMMVTPAIANNIRENDIPAIKNALTDTSAGSITLDAHLVDLIKSKKITKREALKKASSPESLERYLGNDSEGNRVA